MNPSGAPANRLTPPTTNRSSFALRVAVVLALVLSGLPAVVDAVPAELRGIYDMRYKAEIDELCKAKYYPYSGQKTRIKRRRAGSHQLRVGRHGIVGGLKRLRPTLKIRLPRRVRVTRSQRFSVRASVVIAFRYGRPFSVPGRFSGGIREVGSRSKLAYVFRGTRSRANSLRACRYRVVIRAVGFD